MYVLATVIAWSLQLVHLRVSRLFLLLPYCLTDVGVVGHVIPAIESSRLFWASLRLDSAHASSRLREGREQGRVDRRRLSKEGSFL